MGFLSSVRYAKSARMAKHEKRYVDQFYIVGGGCFATQYSKWLLRSEGLDWLEFEQIICVDHDPNCRVARENLGKKVELACEDCVKFFAEYLIKHNQDSFSKDHFVPSHVAPHILFLSFIRAIEKLKLVPKDKKLQITPYNFKPQTPVEFPLKNGDLAVSFARWTCPTNCIEPQRCPKTRGRRFWEMRESLTIHQEETNFDFFSVLQCQHLCHAVATIPMCQILMEFSRLITAIEKNKVSSFAVATISSCHGILSSATIL